MNKPVFSSVSVLTLTITSQLAQSATLSVADAFIAVGDGTNPPAVGNIGAPTSGSAFDYVARERQSPGQLDRRAVTFLKFDASSITLAEANDPGFSAIFTIDHVGHLNNVNTGFDLSFGRNTSGDWDSTTTLPSFSWAESSVDQAVLLERADLVPNSQSLSLDVTSIVQGWVNGTLDNQGIVLLGTRTPANGGNNILSQSSYLNNAEINTTIAVPEPSSLALAGIGLLGLLTRRRL